MQGRRGVVVGIANERSLAYGIAKWAAAAGAELIFTYQNERLCERVTAIAKELGAVQVLPCDVGDTQQIAAVADTVTQRWGALDFMVHAVAYARREELEGRFLNTTRQGFSEALDVSVYSLIALTQQFETLLQRGHAPSILTLSYYGAEKAVPNYNVMGVAKAALESTVRYLARDLGPKGIRVNAISAGAIKTLSSAGIKGLRQMLQHMEYAAPLRRNVSIDDVGQTAAWLLSEWSSAVTAEVVHVDGGYHGVVAVQETTLKA